jgi:hypothetical protein
MNMLNDIATWLASTSTGFKQVGGGSTAYAIYKYQRPVSTGNMHILYQSGGMGPEVMYETIDNLGLQIITLSAATSDLGYSAALTVQNRLRFISNMCIPTTSTGGYYIYIAPTQSPIALGLDENKRMQWSQNFRVKMSYD